MSCSLKNTNKYLINKNLVKSNLELHTPIPSKRLLETIDRLTKSAKTKYGVDQGDLYAIKYRNVETGNYLTQGSAATIVKSRLEPNEGAFEAIDKSSTQALMDAEEQREELRKKLERQVADEATQIASEGNYVVSEGEIKVPEDFPQITIKCG